MNSTKQGSAAAVHTEWYGTLPWFGVARPIKQKGQSAGKIGYILTTKLDIMAN